MKKFVNPTLKIAQFNYENIITVSGAVDKAEMAVTSAVGGVTLDGKTLDANEVIKVTL